MKAKFAYLIVALAVAPSAVAQIGGESTYGFLDLTPSPEVAALGGKIVAASDAPPAMAFYNPALLDSAANNCLSLNYVHYLADINFGYVGYARSFPMGHLAAGIHYVNYGRFVEADATGVITGSFTAAEYAFNFTYSREVRVWNIPFSVGINLKPLLSVFERYSSFGLLADVGIVYRRPEKLFTAALVLRNMGGQLTAYSQGGREAAPFEIAIGFTQGLQNAPLRFSLTLQHLEHPVLSTGKDTNPLTGEETVRRGFARVGDELMRHIVIGVECMPFKGLTIRGGYNYRLRQELKIPSYSGMVGFSIGAGIHVSRFHFDYARSRWHLAGASNHFAIHIDLNKIRHSGR